MIQKMRATFSTSRLMSILDLNGLKTRNKHGSNMAPDDSGDGASDKGVKTVITAVDDQTEADRVIEPGELTAAEDARGGMGRHLGLFSTTFLIIGRIIGTGIFSTPSSITSSVGSVGAELLLWILGAILSFAGLCVWLEFGCMFPRSGGEKVYLEAVYRRPKLPATILFSTQAIMLGFTASGCIVFSSNILIAAGNSVSAWNERGIAIAVILFVTVIHTFTPKVGVIMMNALGSIKILVLLFIVITGFVVLGGGVSRVPDPRASFRHSFAGSVNSSGPYATALFKVLDSYAGWNNAAYVLNEVKRPVRTLKIAGPLGLGISPVLYLLANVAYFAAATPAEIKASGTTVASYFFGKVFGTSAERGIAVFIALSALGNVLTITFAQSRVNQELAKEGVIPFGRFWASNWPRQAPGAGLLLHFISSFIVILAIPAGDAYNFILDVEGYPSSVINVFVVTGLFYLRYKRPDILRPFKAWIIVPALFFVAQVFLRSAIHSPTWRQRRYKLTILAISNHWNRGSATGFWILSFWRIIWPRVGGFSWVERKAELNDGTVVTEFVKSKNV